MLAIAISSVVTGSVYALMALGLVAIHKTTRVFNFANGQMATLGGYMGYVVATRWHWPFLVAVVAGVVTGLVLGLVIDRVLLARIYSRPPLELVTVTVGAGLIIQALVIRWFGQDPVTIREPLSREHWKVLGTVISAYDVIVFVVALGSVALVTLVLQRTKIGLRLRATFDDPVAARVSGINVSAVRSIAWMVGGGLAGLAGVLLAPVLYLTPDSMTTILLAAFAAAVIGGFSSFYGAIVGGILLAFVVNLFGTYVSLGSKNVFLYAFLILFLIVRPFGLFGEKESEAEPSDGEEAGRQRSIARRWRSLQNRIGDQRAVRTWKRWSGTSVTVLVLVVLLAAAAPALVGEGQVTSLTSWLTNLLAVAGVALVLYYGGVVNFGQNGFMAIGAYWVAELLPDRPTQWWWIVPTGAVASGLAGAILYRLCRHLQATYFVLATLAFGLLVPELAVKWNSFTGGGQGKASGIPQGLAGSPLTTDDVYNLIAIVTVVVVLGFIILRNSTWGRLIVAVRDSPQGAQALGISTRPKAGLMFAVGCGLGGLAGGLEALANGLVTPSSLSFDRMLLIFVAAVLAGSFLGSAWGAGLVVLVPNALQNQPEYATLLFGVVVIAAVHLLPSRRDGVDVIRLPVTFRRSTVLGPSSPSDDRPHSFAPLAVTGRNTNPHS